MENAYIIFSVNLIVFIEMCTFSKMNLKPLKVKKKIHILIKQQKSLLSLSLLLILKEMVLHWDTQAITQAHHYMC